MSRTVTRAIGWPKIVLAEDATDDWLDDAADWCLSKKGEAAVEAARKRIVPALDKIVSEFQSALRLQKDPAAEMKTAGGDF